MRLFTADRQSQENDCRSLRRSKKERGSQPVSRALTRGKIAAPALPDPLRVTARIGNLIGPDFGHRHSPGGGS